MQVNFHEPFEGQLYKVVKHTQIIRRQKPTNVCLTILCVFDHFVGLALKGFILLSFIFEIGNITLWFITGANSQ